MQSTYLLLPRAAAVLLAACFTWQTLDARIVNAINFMGARASHDAEAEYRLLEFATDIIEAHRASTELSLAVKGAYGASLLGNMAANAVRLEKATDASLSLRQKWSTVAARSTELTSWLNGNLREDYSAAFCRIAAGTNLHARLTSEGASRSDFRWAFDDLRAKCASAKTPQDAIVDTFRTLADMANANAASVALFMRELGEAAKTESFQTRGLFGYIFDSLAVRAEKPRIFTADEVYFTAVTRFDIYYEALEQIAREAHTLVPGTHNQAFRFFDFNFTLPPNMAR